MVAVTGANGLLGSFIVRVLLKRDIPFVALKRHDSDISLLNDVNARISWRDADVMDPVALEGALKDVTKVIHSAAIVSFNPRHARRVMDCNVLGTRNIVNECLMQGIGKLVHVSSVAALGRQRSQHFIDETNQWVDSPVNTTYAKSKYLAELEVFRGFEEGMSTTIVNPSVILAPADWDKSSARIFRYVWEQRRFYSDACVNYVDVRDVAEITVRLLYEDLPGNRFILNAGNIQIRELFEKIALRFGRKPPGIKLNPSLLRMLARIEAARARFTGKEPLITRESARLAGTQFLYDNCKIKKTLSAEFQPIDATLDWCCQYYLTKNTAKN